MKEKLLKKQLKSVQKQIKYYRDGNKSCVFCKEFNYGGIYCEDKKLCPWYKFTGKICDEWLFSRSFEEGWFYAKDNSKLVRIRMEMLKNWESALIKELKKIKKDRLKKLLEDKLIGVLEDGFYYFFVNKKGLTANNLREIADYLDEKNHKWEEQIEKDIGSKLEEEGN